MVLTESRMLTLGSGAPFFDLADVSSGAKVRYSDFAEKRALLVMFICRHCPYVKHVEKEIARVGEDYQKSNIGIVAISANDKSQYPEDAPEGLAQQARELGFGFPYLYDETQEVAKAYGAVCTPDFFLFDQERKLVYRGQLDDSRPGNNEEVDGRDLRRAIDAVLEGSEVDKDQRPSLGCNIKWKKGNEPDNY